MPNLIPYKKLGKRLIPGASMVEGTIGLYEILKAMHGVEKEGDVPIDELLRAENKKRSTERLRKAMGNVELEAFKVMGKHGDVTGETDLVQKSLIVKREPYSEDLFYGGLVEGDKNEKGKFSGGYEKITIKQPLEGGGYAKKNKSFYVKKK